jgi:hypothetical protein
VLGCQGVEEFDDEGRSSVIANGLRTGAGNGECIPHSMPVHRLEVWQVPPIWQKLLVNAALLT